MKSLENVDTNIFRSNSQFVHNLDATLIKPLWDRCLIRDIPDPDRIGSIWIPETAAERGVGKEGLLRIGVVVAVGPGDKFTREWVERDHLTGQHHVQRKALGRCPDCEAPGFQITRYVDPPYNEQYPAFTYKVCPTCSGDGIRRWPMQCKVGDKVIVDRRKEAEFYVNGERLYLVHEEQAILAVLESTVDELINASHESRPAMMVKVEP